MNQPKIEAVDVGSNCRLGVCCLRLDSFYFFMFILVQFLAIVIIGRSVYWFDCSLFFSYYFLIFFVLIFFYFKNVIVFIFIFLIFYSFSFFFSPFSSELCG